MRVQVTEIVAHFSRCNIFLFNFVANLAFFPQIFGVKAIFSTRVQIFYLYSLVNYLELFYVLWPDFPEAFCVENLMNYNHPFRLVYESSSQMQYLSLRDRIHRSCKPSFDFGFLELFSARTSNDEVREKKNDTGGNCYAKWKYQFYACDLARGWLKIFFSFTFASRCGLLNWMSSTAPMPNSGSSFRLSWENSIKRYFR